MIIDDYWWIIYELFMDYWWILATYFWMFRSFPGEPSAGHESSVEDQALPAVSIIFGWYFLGTEKFGIIGKKRTTHLDIVYLDVYIIHLIVYSCLTVKMEPWRLANIVGFWQDTMRHDNSWQLRLDTKYHRYVRPPACRLCNFFDSKSGCRWELKMNCLWSLKGFTGMDITAPAEIERCRYPIVWV